MLISFPHMGKLHLALARTFKLLDIPYLIPPLPGPAALQLGQELAPEGSCLPFCLVLGNMREALNSGADTLIMIGGKGPCRFGYFVYLAERLLLDAGYKFKTLIIDKGYLWQDYTYLKKNGGFSGQALIAAAKHGWQLVVCDETLSALKREYLPRALDPGKLNDYFTECSEELTRTQSIAEILQTHAKIENHIKKTPLLPASSVLRIGLVGDIYTLLEPYANHEIEDYLQSNGVSVYKEMAVSRWIPNILLPWRKGFYMKELLRDAYPYLQSTVGGFGLESVANTRKMGRRSVDGIIQLFPLGCMPEIVAQSAINRICQKEHLPVLSITMDQHDSITGFKTRLEAFLEMLGRKKGTGIYNLHSPSSRCYKVLQRSRLD